MMLASLGCFFAHLSYSPLLSSFSSLNNITGGEPLNTLDTLDNTLDSEPRLQTARSRVSKKRGLAKKKREGESTRSSQSLGHHPLASNASHA